MLTLDVDALVLKLRFVTLVQRLLTSISRRARDLGSLPLSDPDRSTGSRPFVAGCN